MLLCCDGCPTAIHISCAGLYVKSVRERFLSHSYICSHVLQHRYSAPPGKWFCKICKKKQIEERRKATLWNIHIRRINLYYLEDFENVSTTSATRTTFTTTKLLTTVIRFNCFIALPLSCELGFQMQRPHLSHSSLRSRYMLNDFELQNVQLLVS